jgi:hypothetical protein
MKSFFYRSISCSTHVQVPFICSEVSKILSSEDCSVEKLLKQDEIIQESQAQNANLIKL